MIINNITDNKNNNNEQWYEVYPERGPLSHLKSLSSGGRTCVSAVSWTRSINKVHTASHTYTHTDKSTQ